jgi:hypothetical protein
MKILLFIIFVTVPQVVDAGSTSNNHFLCQWMFGFRFQGDEHKSADDCVTDNKSTNSNLNILQQNHLHFHSFNIEKL